MRTGGRADRQSGPGEGAPPKVPGRLPETGAWAVGEHPPDCHKRYVERYPEVPLYAGDVRFMP